MNAIAFRSWLLVLFLAPLGFADDAPLDVRRGIPADAFLAVYGRQNPERDFQREYAAQVWQTVEDERLPERIIALVMDRLPEEKKQVASSISEELRSILEPVDWTAVAGSPEAAYGQVMEAPQTHHVLLLRMPSEEVAVSCETAFKQLGEMIERRSDGAVDAAVDDRDGVTIYTLTVPEIKEFPFRPALARVDDVVVVSTSAKVVHDSVVSVVGGGDSKFDDPRLAAALEKLPEPEDALVFYDGQKQFSKMRSVGDFIREKAGEDAKAVRFAGIFERAVDELAILDYEVTAEYTEGHRNMKVALGQLVPDAEGKLLYRVCAQGEPFENWQRWVPADAQAYSLATGANLHALYEGVVEFIREELPEAQPSLDKFEQAQVECGVQLDGDVLQAFSGEFVSITLPRSSSSTAGGRDNVVALRCHKSERIRELVGQLVDRLAATPYAQVQQLRLAPCQELPEFEEVSANMLAAFGVRPVIGFHDGWMIVATNPAAAQNVLRTLAGDSPAIDSTEHFRRFGVEIEEPVYAISYTDVAASARRAAQLIRQAGAVAPMIAGIAGAKADPEKLKPLQEALALLPAVANVVDKFDYLEARLKVVAAGDAPGSYVKRSVMLVRPPTE